MADATSSPPPPSASAAAVEADDPTLSAQSSASAHAFSSVADPLLPGTCTAYAEYLSVDTPILHSDVSNLPLPMQPCMCPGSHRAPHPPWRPSGVPLSLARKRRPGGTGRNERVCKDASLIVTLLPANVYMHYFTLTYPTLFLSFYHLSRRPGNVTDGAGKRGPRGPPSTD